MEALKRYYWVLLIIILASCIDAYSQPFFVLEDNVQRDFSCRSDIMVQYKSQTTRLIYFISRKGKQIKISYNLSEFIDDTYEADNLRKLGIDKNIIMFDTEELLTYYIFPDIKAYIVEDARMQERVSDYTFLVDKKDYEYEKIIEDEESVSGDKIIRYKIAIRHKDNNDNWEGYLLESSKYLNFPVKIELRSARQQTRMTFNFSDISFETDDSLFGPAEDYKRFENYTQMLIYAIERQN